jgi:hypothetical protein
MKATAALIVMLLPVCAIAQVKGSINGTVVDSSQSAVPGAALVLLNKDTGESRQANSSEQGYFTFVDLGRGDYSLTIKADGFRELQMGPLELTVGEQLTVRAKVTETQHGNSADPSITCSITQISETRIQRN